MTSLRSFSGQSKRVRALIAGTFFLSITPQKINSFEPATIATAIGYTIVAGSLTVMWKAQELAHWWYGEPSQKSKDHKFDPNCVQCVGERALAQQQAQGSALAPLIVKPELPSPIQTTATQTPNTQASQIHIVNHTTNITASTGSTIITSPDVTAAQLATAPPPMQSIQAAVQTQKVKPARQPPAQIIQPVKTPEVAAAQVKIEQSSITQALHDTVQDLYQKHALKVGVAAAATGYIYILYSISSLQYYLTQPKRISLWFSQYELNKLLLLEFQQMQELLVQEFLSTYNVSDEKSLKPAVTAFMNDMETELASLTRYQSIAGTINTLSSVAENCCTPVCYISRSFIPFSGFVLDHVPAVTINNLFFVNTMLKDSIEERISRIHYYKNIFLQSTIVI